ncbi:MAG: hypothetical protein IID59_06630 [Proteobacteria bacterium]|nr:hypothetical protein [Pseudomonadota bacterium]
MTIQINLIHRISRIVAGALVTLLFAACATSQPHLYEPGRSKFASSSTIMGTCYPRGLPRACRIITDTSGGAARALKRAGYNVRTRP